MDKRVLLIAINLLAFRDFRFMIAFLQGFTKPHDIHVLVDGSAVFVSEIGPNRVWKFDIHRDPPAHRKKSLLF